MTDMNEMSPRLRQDFFARVSANSKKIMWTGIAMVVVGLIAMFFPFLSGITVTVMAGILFLISGVVTLYGAFSIHGTWAFIGALLLGLLQLVAGFYVMFNPLPALIIFTLVIAVMFIVEGIFKVIFAFKIKPEEGWGWALTSGIVSVILGVLIYSEWPGASLVIIGLLMGINFLFSGFY
ncbi:MAG: HdeD family acid-resistance protein, partial [Hyphomicrobiales bacterium]